MRKLRWPSWRRGECREIFHGGRCQRFGSALEQLGVVVRDQIGAGVEKLALLVIGERVGGRVSSPEIVTVLLYSRRDRRISGTRARGIGIEGNVPEGSMVSGRPSPPPPVAPPVVECPVVVGCSPLAGPEMSPEHPTQNIAPKARRRAVPPISAQRCQGDDKGKVQCISCFSIPRTRPRADSCHKA